MTDTPSPIAPDEVPLGLLNEAYREFLQVAEDTGNDDQQALRAAIAVALTRYRDQITGPVRKLADKLAGEANRFDELAKSTDSDGIETSALSAWQAYGRCAAMLSEAISRALLGEEAGDGDGS